MSTRAWADFRTSLFAILAAALPLGAEAQSQPKPIINVRTSAVSGAVSPLLFGANYRWSGAATGTSEPDSGFTYPDTIEQIRDVGISTIRFPAGPVAGLFQWQRAVGPQARREPQVANLEPYPASLDSSFGPDEFGDLLDKTGATGRLVVNFSTASAADAANFIAYMSSPIGSALVNGVDWASRRAASHHPAPYKIAYADVGIGYEGASGGLGNSWLQGEPTSINGACVAERSSCLYAFGGSTRFEHQPAVRVTDWRESAAVSTGEKQQMLYARYAPVAAGSETVWVDGIAWQGLSELAAAGADAKVYRITYPSGAINFGDGVHGAIPPKGSKVTINYTSGPHEGFVDFYRAVKAVNPKIKICSSMSDEAFIRIMGAQHAYDCIEQRPSVSVDGKLPVADGGMEDLFVRMASDTATLGTGVQRTRQFVKQYAGTNAARVQLVLDDCAAPEKFPPFAQHFARSEGAAVLGALCLQEWVLSGAAVAARTSLIEETFKAGPPNRAAGGPSFPESSGDLALFAGPGPETVVTPPALAIKLLRQNTGDTLLVSSIENNLRLNSSGGGALDALQAYSTRDASGSVYLVVINLDPRHDIEATVRTEGGSFVRQAGMATLGAPELSDENDPKNPHKVSIKQTTVVFGGGSADLSFPKHSVTAIKLSPAT